MKKKLFAILTLLFLSKGISAEAVMLPHSMQVYLFNNQPGVSIRFDGLINLPDGTTYLPVIPAVPNDVDKVSVKWTYPENKKLNDNPDIIVFNNNYSLLKVISDGKNKTIASYNHIPEEVKTGVIPQDLLVPNGFYVSEDIAGIIGNLEIPVVATSLKGKSLVNTPAVKENKPQVKSEKNVVKTIKKMLKTSMPSQLNNKMYLVTNFDSNYLKIFLPGRPEPIYGLKLKGVLKDAKVTPDGKYLLTAVFGKNSVDIADISNEQIAKSIDLEMQPSEIIIDDKSNKAYILSTEGKSLFIINLSTMSLSEKVELDAVPYRMSLSSDGNQLAYVDKLNDTIYILKLDDEFKNIPVTTLKNVSKVIIDNNRLYVVSRITNNLKVADYNLNKAIFTGDETDEKGVILQKKLANNTHRLLGSMSILPSGNEEEEPAETDSALVKEAEFKTGFKPTDLYLYGNNLYVLCSGENKLYVFDILNMKFTKQIQLPLTGFARKITRVDNSEIALITDANSKKYCIINLNNGNIIGTYPLDLPVNFITIINKINNVNILEQAL